MVVKDKPYHERKICGGYWLRITFSREHTLTMTTSTSFLSPSLTQHNLQGNQLVAKSLDLNIASSEGRLRTTCLKVLTCRV